MTPGDDQKRTVLLVEDEPMLRASIARGLGRLLDVRVVEAGTVREAVRVLETLEPALLLSDLNLPDGSGIEVAGEIDRRGLRVPVIFVSAYVGRYGAQLARRSDVEVLEKPVPLEKLRRVVEKTLEDRPVVGAPFSVTDYVQLAALGRHSVVVEVRGIKVKGRIVIEKGQARCAEDNLGDGIEAFRRLAFLKSAIVRCRAYARGESFPQNIAGPCEGILLDAARAQDEEEDVDLQWDNPQGAGLGECLADATDMGERRADVVDPAESASVLRRFRAHYEEGIDALLTKDYRRAFDAFCKASELDPDDPHVRANLNRLRQMGYATR